MDLGLPHGPRPSSTTRTSNGCWTCRLRRKKCDERHPVCDTCAALHVTCHYDLQNKPEWMDGGVRQEEMAERLKREAKEHRRRGDRAVRISGDRSIFDRQIFDLLKATPDIRNEGMEPCPKASTTSPQRGVDCTLFSKDARESIAFGRSDTMLLMFYLEHLFPFLFPFYRPALSQGGRSWILEMMISSPVVRNAIICQSSYFFSLARGTANHDVIWEKVLTQTRDAFEMLRQALEVIDGSDITEHMHGAVQIMASIMQVQRFEIAILSFNNCQAHLNAALALFKQLLDSPGAVEPARPSSSSNSVMNLLGPPSWVLPAQCLRVPSAEQAAFRFSSALLILDDIIASTVLQEQPRLYGYHHSLLNSIDSTDPPINLAAVIGCQNWVLLQIGEIAVLDAWKQRCKRAGNLDVMELVHRAKSIKDSLEAHLTQLETNPVIVPKEGNSLLDVLTADYCQQSNASQSSLVTGPASIDVRYHVGRIVELITRQLSPPALLRSMVWPFCVAGCLAEPAQEAHLREMVESLQPPSVFGTVRKALEIMENVWRNRDVGDFANCDLATCFRGQGDLVLLV
ncbi:hypothetical protein BDZ45DRAFT_707235 [Acephala macrosclerotiorum]|nr:hypothetical protein BDZ45DRAFT_707235 [Acephala macrosclerotiorum]